MPPNTPPKHDVHLLGTHYDTLHRANVAGALQLRHDFGLKLSSWCHMSRASGYILASQETAPGDSKPDAKGDSDPDIPRPSEEVIDVMI